MSRSIESLAPFRHSPEKHAGIPAKVEGKIPDWLRGEVVRTCPAIFETQGWRAQHWFDGLGMIYAFRIGGSAIDFRSRLLDSETARDARLGKANLGSFGTPTARPLLRRIFEPVARISDNTNVNIGRLGPELVAMTEGDRQLVIDDNTLAAVRPVAYSKDALGGAIMSAHPHFDFERARVVNVATRFGAGGTISVYEHAPAARQREIVGSWKTSRVPYVHTFGLTPRHAILVAHPFAVSPVKMLWSSKGYIDHFDWHPEEATRLVVIDRSSGAVREHATQAFFTFHTVNAFERRRDSPRPPRLSERGNRRIVPAHRPHGRRAARPQALAHADRHAAGRRACNRREAERRRVRVPVDPLQARQRASVPLRVRRVRWTRGRRRVSLGRRQGRP